MRTRTILVLAAAVMLFGCDDIQGPQGRWVLSPEKETPSGAAPRNETNGGLRIGKDASGKAGDPSSSAEKKVKCSGSGPFCTVRFDILFTAPDGVKDADRLTITYWGKGQSPQTLSVAPQPGPASKNHILSAAGACDELNIKVEIKTARKGLESYAIMNVSPIPAPVCTPTDETNTAGFEPFIKPGASAKPEQPINPK